MKMGLIGRHASENGIASAVRFFNKKNLKESSVRDWKTLYEKQLKKLIEQARPEDKGKMVVESLATKKRGRPPLLGSTLDKNLQEIIVSLRSRGTPIDKCYYWNWKRTALKTQQIIHE